MRTSEKSRQAAAERMRKRWREKPEEMRAILQAANAKASERNKTRWRNDRERMTAIVTENARKGTAVLTGSKFSAERLRKHSVALTGRELGGRMAKGPDHRFAKEFALIAPDGTLYLGTNIIDFVRTHEHLFDSADLVWRKGHCRASKALAMLRPSLRTAKASWKGWTWNH